MFRGLSTRNRRITGAILSAVVVFGLNGCTGELEDKLATAQSELAKLKGELENARSELTAARDELSTAKDDVKQKTDELAAAQEKLAQAQELEALSAQLNDTKSELASLTPQLEQTRSQLDRLRDEISKQQELVSNSALKYRTKTRSRVRREPSTDALEVAVVPEGNIVQVLEIVEDGTWYRVGGIGYIFHELLEPLEE